MRRLVRALARAVLRTLVTAILEHLTRVLLWRLAPAACRLV